MSTQLAYIAGLFDGEGSVDYKKRLERKVRQNKKKKYYCWRISLEMSMTHEGIVRWVHKLLRVGTVSLNVKNKSPSSKPHWKDQWRWRCSHRDAFSVAKLIIPYAHVKREKLQQIINHYDKLSIRHTNDRDVYIHHAVYRIGHPLLK